MNENLVCAITGASGYVGSRIARRLAQNARVVALTRKPSAATDIPWALDSADDIAPLLRQWRVSVLIHAAWDFSAVSSEDIQRVNVEGSIRLLRMAKAAGVGRIVFISTISAFTGARSLYGKAKLQVESVVAELGGIILRPGLVFGDSPGGVFGSIRKQVQHQKFIPLIGNGKAPQFLVPEETLAEVVADAAAGRFDRTAGQPITVANPHPWPFRDLVLNLARAQGRKVTLIPLPWPLLYAGLRAGEILGRKMPFRSDSVVSFVHQDPAPDFTQLEALGITVPPWSG
ncbi:MAG: NAD-dependent epimerase/dehydratase family protein [Acidobacteriaceae bacterium]